MDDWPYIQMHSMSIIELIFKSDTDFLHISNEGGFTIIIHQFFIIYELNKLKFKQRM